jgi:hypothetical protein
VKPPGATKEGKPPRADQEGGGKLSTNDSATRGNLPGSTKEGEALHERFGHEGKPPRVDQEGGGKLSTNDSATRGNLPGSTKKEVEPLRERFGQGGNLPGSTKKEVEPLVSSKGRKNPSKMENPTLHRSLIDPN